jgi:preprotein translocase subunit YajC
VTELVSFLPLVAIALLFWLMVVRPASRRQKQLARIQSEVQPGQRVMLTSGIFGTVRSVTDDRVRVEIATGVEVEVVRPAIGSV